jgi:FAD/FMN-containing dehydrogenase/Fe-S oxidoreductase
VTAVIPRLDPRDHLQGASPEVAEFLAALQQTKGFSGEINTDYATRLTAATDNSIYQQLPAAVVFARTSADIASALKLLDEPRFHKVALTARGGGTGTNGQALTSGIVLDVSRHMREILELNLEQGFVRVQPGVVLDDLNAFLKAHGVYFAPNLSPSNRATVGGMVATDASGEGSRMHGKTSNHVLSLEIVLRGGHVHRTKRVSGAELAALCAEPSLIGRAHKLAREIRVQRAATIQSTFPKLLRHMTGYNLAHMASADGASVDLAQLYAGSEGSLGVISEAKLKLTPFAPHRALFVLRYESFDAALSSAAWLLETDPGSVETIDETVLGLARADVIFDSVRAFLPDSTEQRFTTRAINLVEYSGNDRDAVAAKVSALEQRIARDPEGVGIPHGYAVTWIASERESLWNLRKKGVGLLGNTPGARKPVPFVEDTVVPPENLQAYVREFRAILDAEGLRYGMFGHVDVGCLHVRPALDLKDPADEALIRKISDQVTELVTRHGGLLWGEHGKGYRSELVPHHFGPTLYAELQRIKALYDPRNQLNPGKIATPANTKFSLARIDGATRGQLDRQIASHDLHTMDTVVNCNGNGQCFDTNNDTLMCPSSKITRNRIHSPKGRAGVMREWLRLLSRQGFVATDMLRRDGSLPWYARLWERYTENERGHDFSHQVFDAMDGCLACKACATLCPVRVDVPDFRAQFLELYHRRYARPIGDYMTALLERLLPFLVLLPRLANLFMASVIGRFFTRKLFGIVDAPALDPDTAKARLRRNDIPISDYDALSAVPKASNTVVILQDAFTTFYEPKVLVAACLLLRKLGYEPHVLPYFENGKALHIKGFLNTFTKLVRKNSEYLRQVASVGFPLIGIEPAVVLTYRDEYPKLLEHEAGFHVLLLQEFLAAQDLPKLAHKESASYRLFSHCTEQALVTRAPALWAKVYAQLGVPLELVKTGCCGMCGVYGHEERHLRESLGIFDLSWRRKLDPLTDPARSVVTGHSCRHQVERGIGFTPLHPAEALLAAFDARAPSSP